MYGLIKLEVVSVGIGWIELQYGSLEEYIEGVWLIPITRAVRLAERIMTELGV